VLLAASSPAAWSRRTARRIESGHVKQVVLVHRIGSRPAEPAAWNRPSRKPEQSAADHDVSRPKGELTRLKPVVPAGPVRWALPTRQGVSVRGTACSGSIEVLIPPKFWLDRCSGSTDVLARPMLWLDRCSGAISFDIDADSYARWV
jgi:hypothetical protein